jgi:hypothetical protein
VNPTVTIAAAHAMTDQSDGVALVSRSAPFLAGWLTKPAMAAGGL